MDKREADKRYNASEKGIARQRRYNASAKGRARKRRYYYGLQERFNYRGNPSAMLPGLKFVEALRLGNYDVVEIKVDTPENTKPEDDSWIAMPHRL